MHSIVRTIRTPAIFAVCAGSALAAAAPAGALEFHFPRFKDGSQAFHSRAIAGAGPNWYSTFIRGERCEFRYRTVPTANGPQKLRYEVCY